MKQSLLIRDKYAPENSKPLLRVLSYSGGRQSHAIARMCLRGEMPMPDLVVSADPGNEHKDTYLFRDRTFEQFRAAGVEAVVAPGPKMLDELRELRAGERHRIDNAAMWTESGGQLMQGCTRHYKIRPMDRVVIAAATRKARRTIGNKCIERWIGFATDEVHRCRAEKDRRMYCYYPLIDAGMTRADVERWYQDTGEPMPPPSVCNHCWANSVSTFRRIAETDPEGWEKAKEFDDLSRDLSAAGVREKCFCSATLVPLQVLEDSGFDVKAGGFTEQSCDGGYCFL